jgi:spermidine synthase
VRWLKVNAAAGTLAALGFATGVAQAVLLRETMAALGGSELAWGAVLAVWLAAMGLGAWLGARRTAPLPALAPEVVLLFAAAGTVLLRAVPALSGLVAGEAGSVWRGLGTWSVAVLVPALLGGWAFSGLVRGLDGADAAGRSYALESLGAICGGLAFTFMLASAGSLPALGWALLICLAVSVLTSGVDMRVAALALAALVLIGPADALLARASWRWSARPGELAAARETRQQRLELATGTPAAVYADGRLLATYPDPFRTAARAHLALLVHPAPRRVLAVGALADGGFNAFLKHPLAQLDLVEDDPVLARVLPRWLGAEFASGLSDTRVRVRGEDVVRAVSGMRDLDAIVLFDPDPTTIRRNRSRTAEFFAACAQALKADGVLVVRVGVSDTYLGGVGGRVLAIVAATVRSSLPALAAVPGEEVMLVAGRGARPPAIDPETLTARLRARRISDPELPAELVPVLVDPARTRPLADFLCAVTAPLNTTARPRVVLLAAALHEARGRPLLLTVARALERASPHAALICCAVAVALLLGCGARGARLGVASAVVIGFCSLSWWLVLLAAWQSAMGSVYAEVGALSAAFMAGSVAGALAGRRIAQRASSLAVLLMLGAGLSLVLASHAMLLWPRATIVPLLVGAGIVTGASFPALACRLGRGDAALGAGRGFAGDELGAALAALTIGLLVLPWAGMTAVALALASLEAGAAAAIVLANRRVE